MRNFFLKLMEEFDYLEIIKWVAIVLVAGFIGQFGKSFAKHLMGKTDRGKRKPETDAVVEPKDSVLPGAKESAKEPAGTCEDANAKRIKEEAKIAKKALKASAKLEKKKSK